MTAHGFSQGSEPPEITSISITPSVDVTSGDQTITATIQVTDNELGFDFGNLFLYRADGNFVSSHGMGASQLVSGDTFDGTYEVEMNIPQYAPGGTWEVQAFVANEEGVERHYGGASEPFPTPSDANFTVVNSGLVDSTGPAVVSVSVSPGPIDTGIIAQTVRFRYEKDSSNSDGADAGWVDQVCFSADSDQEEPVIQRLTATPNPVSLLGGEFTEVTVTIEVSDDFNGFSEGYIYLTEDNSGNEYSSQIFNSSHLVSGDSKFGTYEVTFELYPEDFSPEEGGYQAGTYLFTAEIYEETSGNVRYYGNGDDPFPIPGSEFLTIGGGPSGAAPFLTGISSISPDTVDVSSGDETITVEFGVNSNSIGFSYGDVSL